MIEEFVSQAPSTKSPRLVPQPVATTSVIVGGSKLFRLLLQEWLTNNNIAVAATFDNEHSLTDWLAVDRSSDCDVVIQMLSGVGPFAAFRRIHDALASADKPIPLAILADQATRGQVYAALRVGAKAFVNLDAEPDELLKAITMAAANKVYLSPDAAEVLINDVSGAIEPSSSAKLPQVALSRREVEIVQLLCEGMSSKEIARHLHISAKTVENHRYNIYRKCEAESVAGLMRYAIHHGLISV